MFTLVVPVSLCILDLYHYTVSIEIKCGLVHLNSCVKSCKFSKAYIVNFEVGGR